jgi:hypothetical protein
MNKTNSLGSQIDIFMNHESQQNTEAGSTVAGEVELIEYQSCFVAFLDILGFRKKVLESQNSSEILRILLDSLNICGTLSSGEKKVVDRRGIQREISVQSRFFSDSVVFFMKKNQEDIAHFLFMIRHLQDRLWEKGICLRGAATIGDMHWPTSTEEMVTLGPGLLEAFYLESEIAIYPRILVSELLYTYIESNDLCADPFGEHLLLNEYIRQDNDGQHFLDLLNNQITRSASEKLVRTRGSFSIQWYFDAESNYNNRLDKIDLIIEENNRSEDVKIRQKNDWLKSYKKMSCE